MTFASSSELTAYQAGDTDQALAMATALIVGYCGWSILEEAGATYTVPATAGIVQLPTLRLTALAAVDSSGNPLELAWTDYGVVRGLVPAGTVITYTHGWPADEIPLDLKLATLALASDLQAAAATGADVSAETLLGYSVTYAGAGLLDIERARGTVTRTTEILDRYRIVLP